MVEVIGVRFRTAGKIYFFNPKEFQVKSGDHVIVETARGIEFGSVVSERRQVKEKCIGDELKPVLRIATKEDEERAAKNREKEKEAYKICLDKIKEHELDMKLVSTEYTFDNNKVLFYFTADGRVDFRELVKDLAAVFRTRIELRQIGVRDEAKMLGGMGICGRKLCCNTFLSEFAPVSIKMAKEQNLSLNPTKISGVCGRNENWNTIIDWCPTGAIAMDSREMSVEMVMEEIRKDKSFYRYGNGGVTISGGEPL